MKYVLFGAGLQGTAMAFDLLKHARGTTSVVAVDANPDALSALSAKLDDPRLTTVAGDVSDPALTAPLLAGADVALSAVNYWFNDDLAGLAIAAGAHFLDLGGNNDVVAREFARSDEARDRGVAVVPDCGLAPGLAGILGYHLATGLERCRSLKLRVGGLPARPLPPMNYKVVFSVQGLINEYVEPALVIRDGQVRTIPSLTELETLRFPEPFGELEAFQTSGGISTLPQTLEGRVDNLDYKTIRYKGHCAQFRLLNELGLCDAGPRSFSGGAVSPREMLAAVMQEKLDLPGPDVVLLLAEAEGWDEDGRPVRRSIRIIDHADQENGISAMMRMTGYPAAIIARMLAAGDVTRRGTLNQELVVPADAMIAELRRRQVDVQEFSGDPGEPA
ncbi:MAG: saccharopine dehydrogenase C-terminal domain-containing protein [bacterium]